MVNQTNTATVHLWDEMVGAVHWDDAGYGSFEYAPEFLQKGLDIAPVTMPSDVSSEPYMFRTLNRETFKGLPGLLADCLPDKFGNAVIDAWLARQGRTPASFNPIERLCYTGTRGMGALEFQPAVDGTFRDSVDINVEELVKLAAAITHKQIGLNAQLGECDTQKSGTLLDILRVGTSAGGARAKAVIAMNGKGDIRSGQVPAPKGYDYWLLKFDGAGDLELGSTDGYGRVEFAYYFMAREAGIDMTECKLLQENGRAHFMTQRFDRVNGQKLHMQSLCGIAHLDFNMAGAHSYEQLFSVMRELYLPKNEAIQQYRRMVFNVLARNQDDHTKNIAFLMDQRGEWSLSPAFDITYAHNPGGAWTSQHQMSVNGKRDHFVLEDLIAVGKVISIKRPMDIIDEVAKAIEKWEEFAENAGVSEDRIIVIGQNHRKLY
ncbi:type II toxin-antitoxin system HipA family toxin [Microbulbifer sp. OS29]|uniref:Type II toxin-antitoxin system HipA family toxin n=1 Tax=Microbulbifer okhotskensis TaxID=2926617 RepID=A0A9X2ERV2_9GAMM|nr:type II toxin-antitoxin system HipA family toxin [Microbulbifer okhotskensis]MCO1336669.1 type II toxin-antitoxin system HipA family toxin [Microbulbifer okhotskensis]